MNIHVVFSSYVICLRDEHKCRMFIAMRHGIYCEQEDMFIKLRRYDIVFHITMIGYNLHDITMMRPC
jgi:hypothetical protein